MHEPTHRGINRLRGHSGKKSSRPSQTSAQVIRSATACLIPIPPAYTWFRNTELRNPMVNHPIRSSPEGAATIGGAPRPVGAS